MDTVLYVNLPDFCTLGECERVCDLRVPRVDCIQMNSEFSPVRLRRIDACKLARKLDSCVEKRSLAEDEQVNTIT